MEDFWKKITWSIGLSHIFVTGKTQFRQTFLLFYLQNVPETFQKCNFSNFLANFGKIYMICKFFFQIKNIFVILVMSFNS